MCSGISTPALIRITGLLLVTAIMMRGLVHVTSPSAQLVKAFSLVLFPLKYPRMGKSSAQATVM